MSKKAMPSALDSADWLFGSLPAPVNSTGNKRKPDDPPLSIKKPKQEAAVLDHADLLGMSATQVANMLCDIFSSKGKQREENICQCFNDNVVVLHLFSPQPAGAAVIRGRSDLAAALVAAPPACASAERRVFIEVDSDQVDPLQTPTLSLDFYRAGSCPGFHRLVSGHISDKPEQGGAVVSSDDYEMVLYRVHRDKIDAVWVGERSKSAEIRQAVAAMRLGGGRALAATEAWQKVAGLVKEGGLLGTRWCGLRCNYSDYSSSSDSLGLGLGSVSASESWTEAGDGAAAAAEEAAKANQAFERVTAHLTNDAKLAKAVKVLAQMLRSSITPETRQSAFLAIRAAMGRAGARASAEATRGLMAEVVEAAEARWGELVGLGGRAAELARWWRLHVRNTAELGTDDTFAFAKAAKLVQEALEELGERGERYEDGYVRRDRGTGQGPLDGEIAEEEVQAHRAQALLENLKAMSRRYHFAWSKAPVDMCFRLLVDPVVRDKFGQLRPQVEELQDALLKKRQAVMEKQAALEYQTAGFQHGRKGW